MTTRRFRISHTTRFQYTGAVSASHNEVRMTPLTEDGQTTLESRLRIRPLSWSHSYRDYWGTQVTALETSGLHEELLIEAVSTVERYDRPSPDYTPVGLEELRAHHVRDRFHEWLEPRVRTNLPEPVLESFDEAVRDLPLEASVDRVIDIIRGHLDYETGYTVATSLAAEAWEARKGVCQDFVHTTLGALRHLGVPARYVSGYLMPDPEARIGRSLAAESHAWVEWWDGSWRPVDPTNRRPVALEHVVVGRGRDYEDVAPFKGVYLGDEEASLKVDVSITRLS